MENTPKPSLFGSGERLATRPPDPSEPVQIKIARRRAMAQWYEDRKTRAREQYQRWTTRRAHESRSGLVTFDLMGRMAVNNAASAEPNPQVRRQRRVYLMRKWQEFMRRAF